MRVCGGELRGRHIQTAPGRDSRPTSERAREGLYSWLGPRVAGAQVLDLYAGTGALAIEALSRGALHATFVEREASASRVLGRNLRQLGLAPQTRMLAIDVGRALRRLRKEGARFELVLADPPYRNAEPLAEHSALAELLAPAGVLVWERSARSEPCPAPSGLIWKAMKRYGDTAFDWYERALAPQESSP